MNENGHASGFFNSQRYIENRNRLPAEALEPYAGQYVAFNVEGTCILAHGCDHIAVEAMLKREGIDPETVVFSRIPELDEDTWL